MLPGAACATECDDVATTGVFGAACGSCFLTSGLLTEPDTGLLQRYPLHEVNLTAQPALAVAAPSTYSATNFAFASLVRSPARCPIARRALPVVIMLRPHCPAPFPQHAPRRSRVWPRGASTRWVTRRRPTR